MKCYFSNGCLYLDFEHAKNRMYESLLLVMKTEIMKIECPKYGHKPISAIKINTLLQLIKNDNYNEILEFIKDNTFDLRLNHLAVLESEPSRCDKPNKLLNKLLKDINPLLKEEIFK